MAEGEEFNPTEPYTRRLRKILEEYPDGSQVLREILQNSDDAKSTKQIFILDHNTYPSSNLFERKLDRHQGPALLAKNNALFEERDFKSLLNLANSEKYDQFDKIGVMGVGFNSIYHITDSPSFITGDNYVILDPHKWCYNGGVKFNFINHNLAEKYPDQFVPFSFRIPYDEPFDNSFKQPFKGTIFRYPLRDSTESDISEKIYETKEILDMFQKFYENESINCLLFLKYIECICFYELKKGADEPELIYKIELKNAIEVRQNRRLIVENIIPMMDSLNSGIYDKINQLEASYVASFIRQKGNSGEINSKWLILNYLDDLLETEKYFQNNFNRSIRDYKFIPNVGLAVPLNDLDVTGRLFCFLPLPIDMPFLVSVHGYFAVSNNRRSLWSSADNEDLAVGALARLRVEWNKYLFEKVLPKAWVKFLCELRSNLRSDNLYKFWPIVKEGSSGSISNFCKNLLQNVIESLGIDDCVFKGPPSLNIIGTVTEYLEDSYNISSFQEQKFQWLSISNGYLEDEKSFNFDLPEIIGNIGFPVISAPYPVINALKNSKHHDSLKFFSPVVIRTYLSNNRSRWQNISRKEIIELFNYVLKDLNDQNFDELEGFKIIPLADGVELGTLTQSDNFYIYIGPDDDVTSYENDERNIFTNQLNKFVDKKVSSELYRRIYNIVKNNGWNLNIRILDEFAVVDMIRFSLNYTENTRDSEEIPMPSNRAWIYQLWDNLKYRNWDLTKFEDIHLIPTNRSYLRKLKTSNKVFLNQTNEVLSTIFKTFGAVFVDNQFKEICKWDKLSPYIIKPNEILSVLASFRADNLYPKNLNRNLQDHEASALVEYLSNYLRLANKDHLAPKLIEVIKYLPIFTEIDHTVPISLLTGNTNWYLLPREEENSYGKIIYPANMGRFLSASSHNICYILEDIIEIPRLTVNDYWRKYVVPFLELQTSKNIDIIIDKLFDRLSSLLDASLKDILGKKAFVPVGTLNMSRRQQNPDNVRLAKPIELFDPENKIIVDLFFEDEEVFPVGKYGITQDSISKKFFSNLKLLGIKSVLSQDDIISRINTIITRSQTSNVHEDLIRIKALKLLKYIDDNWDKFIIDNAFLNIILEKKWVPTVNASEKKIFSNLKSCRSQKDKYLVCLVTPIVEFNLKVESKVKNKKFLKQLGWDTYPEVVKVIEQLKLCYEGVSNGPPENLEKICMAVYRYMNDAFKASDNKSKAEFDIMKKHLKDDQWILCGGRFYPTEKVIFNLPSEFQSEESLIVELPTDYLSFKPLFKSMGVRDEIGIEDFILIIQNMVKKNKNRTLSENEIKNIIQILERIVNIRKNNKRDENNPEKLDRLLIPSTENKLIGLHEIYFDDMGDILDEEKKREYKIAHCLVISHIAKELEIQTLTGKLYGNYAGDINWDIYEQGEPLTTRIKNIIKDYKITSLFKEFLQNADDAKATQFLIVVDERQIPTTTKKKGLLSDEMEDWQGPAIWIYNNKEFSPDDFQALIKLGVGGKSQDDTKIGKFGIGFNCAFHVTDLPSFVSGKYIVFLDPNAKYLPAQGYPPRRPRGTRIDFIDKKFKERCPDQCAPYEAIFNFIKKKFPDQYKETESCDFSNKFNGTLFRLPLRTSKLANQSEISNRDFSIRNILKLFTSDQDNKERLFQGSNEMLFLRNIESCSLYRMKHQVTPQWEAQIYISNSCREIRKNVTDRAQIYRMGIEITNNLDQSKLSEIWLVCTGGHDKIKPKFETFSKDKQLTTNAINITKFKSFSKNRRLKPRGGVASLLAQSDKKSLVELMDEPVKLFFFLKFCNYYLSSINTLLKTL
ncbi:hypothetical protein C1645_164871 [Glomus cerebriforme]|uniref:Sacsin/Nov domain-containing protein n=1 Tax=Glomus cerebriforme TaxID=658196 RepID=A0A397SVY3_9GLOM|nr:hypothetical protein C1645_164871 [Glomus cerebriforme]